MNHKLFHVCLLGLALTVSHVVANKQPGDIPTHPHNSGKTSYLDKLMESNKHLQDRGALNTNSSLNQAFGETYNTLKSLVEPKDLRGMLLQSAAAIQDMLAQLNMTTQCTNDSIRIVQQLSKNTNWKMRDWAVQMFDSIGKPGPSLTEFRLNWVGNYEQCRAVNAPGDPKLHTKSFWGSYTDIIIGFTKEWSPMALNFQWGLCFPSSCSAGEIQMMLIKALDSQNLSTKAFVYPPDIRNSQREYTRATFAAVAVIITIALLMLIGTTCDVIFIQRIKWTEQRGKGLSFTEKKFAAQNGDSQTMYTISPGTINGGGSDMPSEPSSKDTKVLISDTGAKSGPGILTRAILAFSVYTNTMKFMGTRQAEGSLSAIHGIRFFSMSWVILGHTYFFGAQYLLNGTTKMQSLFQRWTFDAIDNALVSVDTFFTLSGLLTSYLVIQQMKKKGWKINWGLFYFHRFWRLTPPYMLTILLVLGLQRFCGAGAEWATVQPADKENCENYWWTNLLYINNVYEVKDMCFGHSWYLANDMQFFVLSPLMLVPLYFNTFLGLAICGIFLSAQIITTAILSVQNNWQAAVMGGTAFNPSNHFDFLGFFRDYYLVPWCRIGPFVVGIAVGYFLAIYKGRIPLSRKVNVLGWILATVVGLATVYGLREEISGNPGPVGAAAFYNSCARSAWSACVCWVIVSCTSGYGGFVNSLLSWSPFVVLGRLTYMAYLIHPSILTIYYQNMDQLFYLNDLNIIITFLGILVLTNMVAFVLMLGLESPMIGLEKALLAPKRE